MAMENPLELDIEVETSSAIGGFSSAMFDSMRESIYKQFFVPRNFSKWWKHY
jgi:hypothetical protein